MAALVRSASVCTSSGVLNYSPARRLAHLPCLPVRGAKHVVRVGTTTGSTTTSVDPFQAAGQRLQSLLHTCGDGEDELVEQMVAEQAPESRLQALVSMGALITLVSVGISSLCGQDPWGGMGLTPETGAAALVGAAVAVPMAAFRAWSWTPGAARVAPALEDMHLAQLQLVAPWLARMSAWHVGLQMILEVAPVTLLLLPAAQGGLSASLGMYTTALHGLAAAGAAASASDPAGAASAAAAIATADGGAGVAQLGCLALTAGVAALGRGLELGVSDDEYETVQAAMDNADRYYRVMSTSPTGTSDADRSATAFRTVAQAWMDTRNEASLAAAALCFADVMALGGLWFATGNLAASLVAAFAINAVDYHNMHKTVLRREAKVVRHSRGGGGGSGSGGNSSSGSSFSA